MFGKFSKVYAYVIRYGRKNNTQFGADELDFSIWVGNSRNNKQKFCNITVEFNDTQTEAILKVDNKIIKTTQL